MPKIALGDDISQYHSDPMTQTIEIECFGDDYDNVNATGLALEQLHKDLARLDLPYFFVKIITTNTDIERELSLLHKIHSTEPGPLEYELVDGVYDKRIYNGDSKCVLPWIHKYVNPQGLVLTCCVGNENSPLGRIQDKNLEEISTKHVRQQMEAGQRPSECYSCWRTEDLGLTSSRQTANQSFNDYNSQTSFVLRHLDIRLSNKCNLMCRMCSGKFSNRIAQEEQKLYGTTKYKDEVLSPNLVDKQLDFIRNNVSTISSVYFAGGEPLINPTHWHILDKIKDPKSVSLQYNSNLGSVKKIDEYWPRFKKVEVNASMDSVGKLGEYLRYGTKWEKWEENLHFASKFAKISVNPTVSVLNIFHLKEIEDWCKFPLYYNILTDPQHLCVSVLPNELKKSIKYVPDNPHLKQLLNVDNSWLFPHTMSFILLQDKIKNTNIWDSLPFTSYAIQEYMKEGI